MLNKLLNPILELLPESNRFERIWKLAQVDFKKRYYNDKFGMFWALLNPIFQVMTYYVAFTYFLDRSRQGIPNFALFLFSAIIFWMEFNQLVKQSLRLLLSKKYLIENIKVNRVDLFLSIGLSSLIGFLFNLTAFIIISLFFDVNYSWQVLYIIVLILTLYLLSLGFGMICAVLYIYFKDIVHFIDIFMLIGFWCSGVIFPTEKILAIFQPLYYLNPFLGIFTNIRAILVYNGEIDLIILNINLLIGIIVYIAGVYVINNHSYKALEKI